MFQFFSNFFSGSWARIQLTVNQIIWALGIVIAFTIVGIIPAFCGASIKQSLYLSFPIWIFSAYRIFGIWRYLHVTVAGEVLDGFEAIGPEKNKTIWDSELAATYRKYAVNVWLAQTIIFLAAPLYFNLSSGGRLWLPILIMVVFAIAMISVKAGLWLFRTAAVVTIAIFLLVAGYDMFPQVGYIPFVSEEVAKLRAGKLAGENARALGEIHALREKQRQGMVASIMLKVATWQKQNPGRDLPENLKKEIEAAKLGLTVSEYEKKLVKLEEKGKKDIAEVKEGPKIPFYPSVTQVSGSPITKWAARFEIEPGKWLIEPLGTRFALNEGKESNWKVAGKEGIEIKKVTKILAFAMEPVKVSPL